MGACSAVNCSNSEKKGFRMFRFPTPNQKERLAKWVINCRRKDWEPTANSRLCEAHFEESQYLQNREDGWKKLQPNAVPTLFDVPNPPKRFEETRKSIYKKRVEKAPETGVLNLKAVSNSRAIKEPKAVEKPKAPEVLEVIEIDKNVEINENIEMDCQDVQCKTCDDKEKKIAELQAEINAMKKIQEEYAEVRRNLSKFLNEDQIEHLKGENGPRTWSTESIIKGVKLRIALQVHGYKFLYQTGYPTPAYSTITERLRKCQLDFGFFENLLEPLRFKVQQLDPLDRFCFLSLDEMEIDGSPCVDKYRGKVYNQVTLKSSNEKAAGRKLLVALIRGVKTKWKQTIACHLTNGSVDGDVLKQFLLDCNSYCEKVGLCLLAVGSDMGHENQRLWNQFDVKIQRNGVRRNFLQINGKNIFVVPDACHLLKNLKTAMLKQDLILPEAYCIQEKLEFSVVKGSYVTDIFARENGDELKYLHHLNREDLHPDTHQKMNVGSAVRFFSKNTAQGIEDAVEDKILPAEALTTAHFIERIEEWFEIASSRLRKTSITKRNRERKYDVLCKMIVIFEELQIGGNRWKPLNTGMVMYNLSMMDIANTLFANGCDFVMGSRFTQDALENVFSGVRRRSGSTPNAKQCLESLKMLCISQYISDIGKTNYVADSDVYLMDFFKSLPPENTPTVQFKQISMLNLDELRYEMKTYTISELIPTGFFNFKDLNLLYNIAGSTTFAVLKRQTICDQCREALKTPMDVSDEISFHVRRLNKGGLHHPCEITFALILNSEIIYRHLKSVILHNSFKCISQRVAASLEMNFKQCEYNCDIKSLIIEHFFTVRCYSYCRKFSCNKQKKVYGSATRKNKKVG